MGLKWEKLSAMMEVVLPPDGCQKAGIQDLRVRLNPGMTRRDASGKVGVTKKGLIPPAVWWSR
jgi:hypothetical protein